MGARSARREIQVGDNRHRLASLAPESINLAYLDPPFNSGRSYEAYLGVERGRRHTAFADTWTWSDAVATELSELEQLISVKDAEAVRALVRLLGETDLAAYLVMMASRLGAIHRALSPEGSLYLHCDPAASHYLKVLLDRIFGPENFRSEIVWKRTFAHSGSRRFGPVHDVVLFYSKTSAYRWTQQFAPYDQSYITKYFTKEDERGKYQLITCTGPGDRTGTRAHYAWRGKWPPAGRHWAWTEDRMEELESQGLLAYSANGVPRFKRYVDDGPGVRLQDIWMDISPLGAHSAERTGFETQKPLALLDRIIRTSSTRGDIVLDPFSGSGTTAAAAEGLQRSWVVMDNSLLAASLTLSRVRQVAGLRVPIQLQGFPSTPAEAKSLQARDPLAFGSWGTGMLGTLLARRGLTHSVASGAGTLVWEGGSRAVTSWIPLTPGVERECLAQLHRGEGLPIVLKEGNGGQTLAHWLSDQGGCAPMTVNLRGLTSQAATESGIAPLVLEALEQPATGIAQAPTQPALLP